MCVCARVRLPRYRVVNLWYTHAQYLWFMCTLSTRNTIGSIYSKWNSAESPTQKWPHVHLLPCANDWKLSMKFSIFSRKCDCWIYFCPNWLKKPNNNFLSHINLYDGICMLILIHLLNNLGASKLMMHCIKYPRSTRAHIESTHARTQNKTKQNEKRGAEQVRLRESKIKW